MNALVLSRMAAEDFGQAPTCQWSIFNVPGVCFPEEMRQATTLFLQRMCPRYIPNAKSANRLLLGLSSGVRTVYTLLCTSLDPRG